MHWDSEPDWDAPTMPQLPRFQERTIGGQTYWAIDWCHEFSRGLHLYSQRPSVEMRGFQAILQLRIQDSGVLVFWDDDGCIVRRDGKVVHEDRECHPLTRHEIPVRAGDCLEIAHWQYHGEWIWAGRIEAQRGDAATLDIFNSYLPKVQKALRKPNGPPLKMYFGGAAPALSVLSLYSLILNGYRPPAIHVFGEYQWKDEERRIFEELLPFVNIVPTAEVSERVTSHSPELAALALRHWHVMKLCVGLLCPPDEYCFMDDDLFVFNPFADAQAAFKKNELVYAPDADYSQEYGKIWGAAGSDGQPLIGNLNTGLYWLRNNHEPREIAARLLRVPAHDHAAWQWEQGFMATEFAASPASALSGQRYFYPYLDGLPGGLCGYDYRRNPCGFATIHFCGLTEKPSESVARMLAAQLLNRLRRRGA